MFNKATNIASKTLRASLKELDAKEARADDDYAKIKKNIADERRELHKAIELIESYYVANGEKPKETRGRKAEEFDPYNYPYQGTFFNKLLFAIYSSKRFLHAREIADFIIRKEASYNTPDFIALVGRRLWKLQDAKKIVQYRAGSSLRNIVYGMPEWLDENKKIKKGYEPEQAKSMFDGIEDLL